jgi:hypothetical protein
VRQAGVPLASGTKRTSGDYRKALQGNDKFPVGGIRRTSSNRSGSNNNRAANSGTRREGSQERQGSIYDRLYTNTKKQQEPKLSSEVVAKSREQNKENNRRSSYKAAAPKVEEAGDIDSKLSRVQDLLKMANN